MKFNGIPILLGLIGHENLSLSKSFFIMKKGIFFVLSFVLVLSSMAQEVQYKSSYKIYDGKGKEVGYFQMLEGIKDADILLFGELHNNALIHCLQLEVTSDLSNNENKKLVLGAEMYSTDQQLELDEYLSGITDDKTFEKNTKQWPNYKTDYKPLVQLAKEKQFKFIACNAPRALSLIAFRKGIDSVHAIENDSARQLLAPLPLEIDYKDPGYKELLEMDFGSSHQADTKKMVQAQALKDATMAENILKNLGENQLFIHYNGDFHSKNFGGIYGYLKSKDKKKNVITISSMENANCDFPEDGKKRADFIIVVPPTMAKSY